MKYIFVAGAPGSKWSGVSKSIYFSSSIDRSDYSDKRTYYHSASGERKLMHLGAYFDPGMEFGSWFDKLGEPSIEEHEQEFNRPFSGTGIKIIKSHFFSYIRHIAFLKKNWPDCPVVLVQRSDDACLGWWVKCGHFDITYPNYKYYESLKLMATLIEAQNQGIWQALRTYPSKKVENSTEMCDILGLEQPESEHFQNYTQNDIAVYIL